MSCTGCAMNNLWKYLTGTKHVKGAKHGRKLAGSGSFVVCTHTSVQQLPSTFPSVCLVCESLCPPSNDSVRTRFPLSLLFLPPAFKCISAGVKSTAFLRPLCTRQTVSFEDYARYPQNRLLLGKANTQNDFCTNTSPNICCFDLQPASAASTERIIFLASDPGQRRRVTIVCTVQ